jgi:hypothetical protein
MDGSLIDCSMKATPIALTAALLVSGCRSLDTPEVPIVYPLPTVPLSQFFKSPADGIYCMPESVATSQHNGLPLTFIIVSGGKVRLSCSDHGRVGTNDWNFVEFRASLPPEETLQQIGAGTTEAEIERRFGKPTREEHHNWRWPKGTSSSTRIVVYSLFTVSQSSELTFMRLTVMYTRTKDEVWTLNYLKWAKWGDRRVSLNHSMQRTEASRFAELPFPRLTSV